MFVKHWILTGWFCSIAAVAIAQPNLMVMADNGSAYVAVTDVSPGSPFDVLVNMDSGGLETSGAAFVFPGLDALAPGVFRVATAYPSSPPGLTLDVPVDGAYALDFDGCAAPCTTRELLRITYFDFSGVVGADLVLTVQGPNGPQSPPLLTDCSGAVHEAPMGGVSGGTSAADVVSPDGSLMLNPTPMCVLTDCGWGARVYADCDAVVAAAGGSFALLKSRFLD